MKLICVLVLLQLFILQHQLLYSQDTLFSLHSEGKIPKEVFELTSTRIKSDRTKIESQSNRATRVAERKFHYENNYFMNQLYRSGGILFGNELNQYVQNVGNYIIKCNPSIDSNIRFYVTKSTEVNAFSTNKGIIFINIGLLAYIKNEAQLAYILCHEIVHYEKRHTIDRYTEGFKLEKTNQLDFSQKLETYVKYSKSQEEVADSAGFLQYFVNTNYKVDEAIAAFEILRYSEFPIENMPFDIYFLVNDTNYLIPEQVKKYEYRQWESDVKVDDSEHLHPNILKRINSLNELKNIKNDSNNLSFIVSQIEFFKVQELARRELAKLYIQNGNYDKALYQSFCMLNRMPEDRYYKSIARYSLYAIAKYKGKEKLKTIFVQNEDRGGGHMIMEKYLKSLSTQDMYKLALRNLYQSWKIENNEFSKKMFFDLLKEVLDNQGIADKMYFEIKNAKNDFSNDTNLNSTDTIVFVPKSVEEYLQLSKIEKVRYNNLKEKNNNQIRSYFVDNIWVGLLNDSVFVQIFILEYKKYHDIPKNPLSEVKMKKEENKSSRNIIPNSEFPKIDSLLIFNPFYYKSVYKKVNSDKIEKKEREYIQVLESNASLCDIEVNILDIIKVKENDIKMFNDFSTVNSWVDEYLRLCSDLAILEDSNYSFIPFHQPYMDSIMKEYNTRFIGFTGVISTTGYRNLSGYKGPLLTMLSFFYLPLPLTLYYFITPSNKTIYTFIVMDITTGKIVSNEIKLLKGRDYSSILKSQVYNSYYDFKN